MSDALPELPEDKYGYELALIMAGAKVHTFEQFGSYQGDWWARVTYDGKTGWIHDYFGSCSVCDSFEANFGWCDEDSATYPSRLAAFGREYLENIMTDEEAVEKASENIAWDTDADGMVAFLKKHSA